MRYHVSECYSAKCITQNYREQYGAAMLVSIRMSPNMAAGNHWKHLEFTLAMFEPFVSLLNLQTLAYTLLLTHWLFRPKRHVVNRRLHVRDSQKASLCHALQKMRNSNGSIFKTKRATELKTCKPLYF